MVNHCHTGNVEMEWNMVYTVAPSVFNAWEVCALYMYISREISLPLLPMVSISGTAKDAWVPCSWGSALPLQSVYLHNAQPLGEFDNWFRKEEWHRQTTRQNSPVNLLPFYSMQEPYETACLHGWGWFPQLGGIQKRKLHAGVKRAKGKFWTWFSPLHLVALWLWTRY